MKEQTKSLSVFKYLIENALNNKVGLYVSTKGKVAIINQKEYERLLKTREETIREVEEGLPLFEDGYLPPNETMEHRKTRNETLKEVRDILNKLKK